MKILTALFAAFVAAAFAGVYAGAFWVIFVKIGDRENIELVVWAVWWVTFGLLHSDIRQDLKAEGLL